jgi:hypothetical protein
MKKKQLKPIMMGLLLCLGVTAHATEPVIDGVFSDWTSIGIAYSNTSPTTKIKLLKTYVTPTKLYFYLQTTSDFTFGTYNIYFNTDNNTSTGLQQGYYSSSGAEIWIQTITTSSAYHYNAAGVADGNPPSTLNISSLNELSPGGDKAFEFSVDRALFLPDVGLPTFAFNSNYSFANSFLPETFQPFYQIMPNSAVLSVDLIAFGAKRVGSTVVVDWSTSLEKENSHFDISRSFDGVSFEKLAEIPGNIDSRNVKTYSYTDQNPRPETTYYQLKQVDLNGQQKVFNLVTVSSQLSKNQFQLSLSPAANSAALKVYSDVNTVGQFQLSDLNGRFLINCPLNLIKGFQSFNFPLTIHSQLYVAALTIKGERLVQKVLIK